MAARTSLCPLVVILLALCLGGCKDYPTRSINRQPSISSVELFPTVIGQGDSLVVTVFASDPDGDPIVYDWDTDSRLVIKGAQGVVYLYSSPNRSQVFYRSAYPAYSDSAWIYCEVRDRKGGSGFSHPIWIGLRD